MSAKGHGAVDEDFVEEDRGPVPYPIVAGAFLLLVLFPFVAYSLGWCKLAYGPRSLISYAGLRVLASYVAFGLGLHVILFLPVLHFVYPHLQKKGKAWLEIAGLTAFLVPPLYSFVFYLGGQKNLLTFTEMAWMVVPGIVTAAIFYVKTHRMWLFSVYASVALFIPLYVINDVMGPYFTLVNYFPRSESFYVLRGIFLTLSVAVAAVAFSSRRDPGPSSRPSELPTKRPRC